jgi:chemotaxis response regulator CheB
VVQDPDDAAYSDMPQSALDTSGADHCVPLKDMAPLLESLSHQGAEEDAVGRDERWVWSHAGGD